MLHLRIISGAARGRILALDAARLPLGIGRDPDNGIVLDHTAISRYHCRIVSDAGAYHIEDLRSTNGTFLNGRRVERERLSPGDELIVGSVGMVIEATPVSIHRSQSPLSLNVSVDLGGSDQETLTHADRAEEIGARHFLDGFSEDRGSRSYRALELLFHADRALATTDDTQALLGDLLDLLIDHLEASRGFVFLLQRETGNLVPWVRRPVTNDSTGAELIVSQTILQMTVRKKSAVISRDALVDERFIDSRSVADLAVRGAMCVPMLSRGRVVGVVYVDSGKPDHFDTDHLAMLSAVALKAGVAVDAAGLYDDLRSLFYNTVETLVRTIQARDPYTSGHSTRVSRYSLLIADKLKLSSGERHQLYLAAMLHDIGKIGVPDDLLNRPGKLNESEMEQVRQHVQLGASMIEMLGEMHPIVPLIRHHHECWDGSGYPDGLKGEEIPLLSRIVAVADMYDAMTSDRPYRERRTQVYALAEIQRCNGTKLDPRVANAFLEVLTDIAPHEDDLSRTIVSTNESPVR